MPQTLKCTHCGAVMKSANPIAAGKKVKCAKCGQVFTVADEEEEKEAPAVAEDEGAKEDAPVKKKGKASDDAAGGDDKKAPPKKGKGLMIGLIVGGLLIVCCCCGVVPGGGYWTYSTYFQVAPFHGAWTEKDNPFQSVQFLAGNKAFVLDIADALAGKKLEPNATWKIIDSTSFELAMNDSSKKDTWIGASKVTFTYVISGDDLTLTNKADAKKVYRMKRATDDKKPAK